MSTEPVVVVFDGTCVLCSGWVDFILKHDRDARFRLAAMQTEVGARLMGEHGLDPDDPMSLLVLDGGRAYTDSEGVLRVLQGLGGVFRLAAAARLVPRFVRDPAYRLVARNRYRWFGRRAACRVPDESVRDRFLA